MEECRNYLKKHVSDLDTFREGVNGWIARAEHTLLVSAFDVDSEVKPEVSVSRVDSQVWSDSSRYSSRLSSRTNRIASSEERKFRLSQEEARLNLV